MVIFALALMLAVRTFTRDDVQHLSLQALADAMLGAEHPPIAKVRVHPTGMEPRSASVQDVTFVGMPAAAPGAPGWCHRTDLFVHLTPLTPGTNAWVTAVPTRVQKIDTLQFYRIDADDCTSADATFFLVRDSTYQAQFALIEQLLTARNVARGTAPLPFALQCLDEDGDRSPSYGGDGCRDGAGRALLASLPLEQAYDLSPVIDRLAYPPDGPPYMLHRDAQVGMSARPLSVDATITEADGRITAIRLKRHIPYPF